MVDTSRTFVVFSGLMIVFGLLFLMLAVTASTRHPAALLGVAFTLLWLASAIRINRMGVYYSEFGVRSRSFLRTRTVPWASVAKFEDAPAASNPWNLGSSIPARAIWIMRWDGETIQTPLVYELTGFLGDGPVLPRGRNRWQWSAEECRAALKQLNKALEKAREDLTEA